MTDAITEEEMAAKIAELAGRSSSDKYRYFRPLSMAVDEYEHWARTPEKRVYLGLPQLDEVMRGTAPGEMTQIVGYAQSGKTLLLTNMMLFNHDKSIAWFTPDETRQLVMVRLACALHGVSAFTIERGLMEGNPEVRRMMYEAAEHFPMLGVYEEGLTVLEMLHAMEEQMEAVGKEPVAVVFDYASLLNHEGEVRSKLEALKNFGKNIGKPMFVVQQTSRHAGRDGERIALDSGEYGGEQQATHIIGMRRKFQYYQSVIADLEKRLANPAISVGAMTEYDHALREAQYELEAHRHTVTVSLVKNKRPPSILVDEIDFHLDTATGRLLEHAPLGLNTEPVVSSYKSARQQLFGED